MSYSELETVCLDTLVTFVPESLRRCIATLLVDGWTIPALREVLRGMTRRAAGKSYTFLELATDEYLDRLERGVIRPELVGALVVDQLGPDQLGPDQLGPDQLGPPRSS